LLSAYLLVTHGSSDPRPQASTEQLAQLLCQKLEMKKLIQMQQLNDVARLITSSVGVATTCQPLVGTACLELAPLPLHEQIKQFSKYALAEGFKQIQVLPLFLLPGVHVMEDIPAEVAIAKQSLASDLTIEMRPYLGLHPGIAQLLATNLQYFDADGWILLSHGTRRQGANQPVEILANKFAAIPAYWSVPPNLETQVKSLLLAGKRRIGILPYFLFKGGITDAIAKSIKQMKQEFPAVKFYLAEPLGTTPQLADLILDLTN